MSGKRKAIFLDKDGTLIENVPFNVDPGQIRLAPSAESALPRLCNAGFRLVVVSNQPGVARGLFPEAALARVYSRIAELLNAIHVALDGFYYCPHHPAGVVPPYASPCDCRKPRPGLLLRAASEMNLDLGSSWLIGDILDDVEAGHAAGCRSILIANGNETEWKISPSRWPDYIATDLASAAKYILGSSRMLPAVDARPTASAGYRNAR
ncbi:MAG: HAD family hydrolase [Bryobacteraceae bacterium]|nr:HAD family hydrolase [Bryobacteraceae bacterium]